MNERTLERLRRHWLIIAFLVVVLFATVRWAERSASTQYSKTLDTRLSHDGATANADVLGVERDHLTALRSFTFTTGFPEALASLDIATVQKLLSPVDANTGIPMVDILDTKGRVVFAFRANGMSPPIYRDRGSIGIVASALSGQADDLGERYSTLLVTDEGPLIASTGPVRIGTRVVGAVLVMTPLERVLGQSTTNSGAFLTVYSGTSGLPLATTAPVKPRALPTDLHHLLPQESLPVTSSYGIPGGKAREQLGALIVRHQPVAWLGVGDRDRTGNVGVQIIVISMLGMLAVIALTIIVTILWTRDDDDTDTSSGSRRERDDEDDDIVFPIGELPMPSRRETVSVPQGGRPRW